VINLDTNIQIKLDFINPESAENLWKKAGMRKNRCTTTCVFQQGREKLKLLRHCLRIDIFIISPYKFQGCAQDLAHTSGAFELDVLGEDKQVPSNCFTFSSVEIWSLIMQLIIP
jgi:hypothetical protein